MREQYNMTNQKNISSSFIEISIFLKHFTVSKRMENQLFKFFERSFFKSFKQYLQGVK